jgi:hypothetical protein
MSRKKRSDAGKPRGPRKPKTEGAVVVQMPKGPSAAERKLTEFYAKYPYVVPGSVREPTAADTKAVSHCHGKVCTVRCTVCNCERTVNLQDAFQSSRCSTCRVAASKTRRAERAAAREAKRAANG